MTQGRKTGGRQEETPNKASAAGIGYLLFDPFMLPYKDDPRFAAFCRKVGLPVPGEVRQQT